MMFSSKTDLWETPQELFDELDREFHFALDTCALPENAKCARYYTPEQDGLSQPWKGVCWCNPPYGRGIGRWVEKASASAADGATVVMLIPARTDTEWFHSYILGKTEIRFIKGRVKFGNSRNGAPFPSMVVVFRPESEGDLKNGTSPFLRFPQACGHAGEQGFCTLTRCPVAWTSSRPCGGTKGQQGRRGGRADTEMWEAI